MPARKTIPEVQDVQEWRPLCGLPPAIAIDFRQADRWHAGWLEFHAKTENRKRVQMGMDRLEREIALSTGAIEYLYTLADDVYIQLAQFGFALDRMERERTSFDIEGDYIRFHTGQCRQ